MAAPPVTFAGFAYPVSGAQAFYQNTGTVNQGVPPAFNQNIRVYLQLNNAPPPVSLVRFYLLYTISIGATQVYFGALDLSAADHLIFNWVSGVQGTLSLNYAAEYWDLTGARQEVVGITPYAGNFTPVVAVVPPTVPATPVFDFTTVPPVQLAPSLMIPLPAGVAGPPAGPPI